MCVDLIVLAFLLPIVAVIGAFFGFKYGRKLLSDVLNDAEPKS